MRYALLLLAFLALEPVSLAAQSLQVEKAVGEPVTIAWNFATTSETEIDSFVVEACTGMNTGCADFATKLKTDRTHTFTVAATTKPFYQLRTVKGTTRSTPSNPVAITLKIPPPFQGSIQ